MRYRSLLVTLILLIGPYSVAQSSSQAKTGNVKVRVIFFNDRAANIQAHIRLMNSASNSPVAESFTNDAGMAEFSNVAVGNYHVLVSGEGIEDTDSGLFEVDFRKGSQYLFINVRRAGETVNKSGNPPDSSIVSAADLHVPENARKEFDKASDLMAKEDWKHAIEHLERAVTIYPKYTNAYNNLGVAYSRLGDRVREREALQRAIGQNDHFAPALVNLARMDIKDQNFPEAETYLNKATVADPANPQTLTLLADMQLLDKRYDDAIATMRKVHAMPHEGYALVHYIAARAFEHENRLQEAISELQTFLKEEPAGARAEAVRKEMADLQSAQ